MRRLIWVGVLLLLVLPVAWPTGKFPGSARAQGLINYPTVAASPSSGPAGTFLSLSALGFIYYDAGSQATISWDGSPVGASTFVTCTDSSAGFGSDCSGSPVFFTVPSSAAPGSHTITVTEPVIEGTPASASCTFNVTGQIVTATDTPTTGPKETPTSTPGLIISTLTATPRPKVTATKTPTPRPKATPKPTPTIIRTAVPDPLGNAAKLIDGHLDQAWISHHVNGGYATIAFSGEVLYRLTGVVIDPGTSPGQDSSDLRRFRVYASSTDRSASSFHLVFEGTCEQNNLLQRFVFPSPVVARYLQIVAGDNYGNPNTVILAEFEAVGHPVSAAFQGDVRMVPARRTDAKKATSLGQVKKIVRGLGVAAQKDKLRTGHVHQSLFPRYALRTLKKQEAGIQFLDGTMLYLDQNTDAVLSSPSKTTVKRGITEQKIEPGTNHSITTASATADAIGTDFVTHVQGTITSIYVVEGAVLVHNQFGFVVVKTGQFTTVEKGSAPQQPAPYAGTQNPLPNGWSQNLPDPHLPENFALDANGGRVLGTSG